MYEGDFLLIDSLFDVQTPLVVKKDEFRQLVAEALGERSLLADVAVAIGAGKAVVEPLLYLLFPLLLL